MWFSNMKKKTVKSFMLRVLACVMLIAAVLKGHELLTASVIMPAANELAEETGGYVILEPGTWAGKELSILKSIDIGKKLKQGNWLLVLYHHDCLTCLEAISRTEELVANFRGNDDFLRSALIEIPPYGSLDLKVISYDDSFILGQLEDSWEWLITTPAIIMISEGRVLKYWSTPPTFDEILNILADCS